MNKTRKKIENLKSKIIPLQVEINRLEEQEIMKVQRPRLQSMIGMCLQSIYENKTHYARILDIVEDKDETPWFILECVSMQGGHNPYIHLDNTTPYLNKEWWDAPVPISGYKPCSDEEYFSFREKVFNELATQKLLKKFCKNYK